MLHWLRRFLTDTQALEERLRSELRSREEQLGRRILVLEQRLEVSERALDRLGHRVARIDGRTSLKHDLPTSPENGAAAPARPDPEGVRAGGVA